jgi:hypothetical protein
MRRRDVRMKRVDPLGVNVGAVGGYEVAGDGVGDGIITETGC